MVWVISRFRFKAPPVISSSYISPLTSSGQRSRASWASQPQKSATLLPQPGGKTTKVHTNMWWHWKKKTFKKTLVLSTFSSVSTIITARCALFVTLPLASKVRVRPKTMPHYVIEIRLGILKLKPRTSLCLDDGLRFVIKLNICSSKCYYPQNHYH